MIPAEKIAAVMGMPRKMHSLDDLSEAVARGLPKKVLRATLKHVTTDREVAKRISGRLIAPATFKRRRTVLTPQESERVERLARVFATAHESWGNEEDTRQFLFAPHPMLNNRRPIDAAMTELGARQVEEILWSLQYGLPA